MDKNAVPSLSWGLLGLGTPKSCLSFVSMRISASASPERKVSHRLGGSVPALCFLATGFQAFEVQLVLRQALPDIWTVPRDQGVSSHL